MGEVGVWEVIIVILGILFWLAIASLTYHIAQSKGHGSILWFIVALFFPVITLIIVIIMPYRNRVVRIQMDDGRTAEGKIVNTGDST